jgi:hypothetical protein
VVLAMEISAFFALSYSFLLLNNTTTVSTTNSTLMCKFQIFTISLKITPGCNQHAASRTRRAIDCRID